MKSLEKTSEQQNNHTIQLSHYLSQTKQQGFSTTSLTKIYYPYNQQIVDFGWGCAWRAIQTALSPVQTSFQTLFQKYATYNTLISIIKERYTDEKILAALELKKEKWCPEYSSNHWAEPFIGRLVLDDYKIENELILVNGIPSFANVPENVFDRTVKFQEFKQKLVNHFDNKRGVIFLDDATFALCIWGYRKQGNNITLLIADPHIKSNKQQKFNGLYTISLDPKGNLISHSVTPDQQKHFGFASYSTLYFSSKNWMTLFIFS